MTRHIPYFWPVARAYVIFGACLGAYFSAEGRRRAYFLSVLLSSLLSSFSPPLPSFFLLHRRPRGMDDGGTVEKHDDGIASGTDSDASDRDPAVPGGKKRRKRTDKGSAVSSKPRSPPGLLPSFHIGMLLMEIQKNGYTASLVKVFFAPDEDPRWIWCLLCRTAHTKSDGVQVSEVVATGHCERVLCTYTNNQSTSLSCSLSVCFVVEPICASRSGQAWTWAISTAERYLDRVIQGVCRSWHRLRRCRGTEACAETVDHDALLYTIDALQRSCVFTCRLCRPDNSAHYVACVAL